MRRGKTWPLGGGKDLMPGFTVNQGRHYISYITGPSHVLLGIKFGSRPTQPRIIRTAAHGNCSHGELAEAEIKMAVTKGLEEFRRESGAELHAEEIVYVENDSPRYDMYTAVAYMLAKHLFNGGRFEPAA